MVKEMLCLISTVTLYCSSLSIEKNLSIMCVGGWLLLPKFSSKVTIENRASGDSDDDPFALALRSLRIFQLHRFFLLHTELTSG